MFVRFYLGEKYEMEVRKVFHIFMCLFVVSEYENLEQNRAETHEEVRLDEARLS